MTAPNSKSGQPRGIRNNNPGNIEKGKDKWQGLVLKLEEKDPRFCEFKDPTWGIRALARVLISYQDKHRINTIMGIINRWAPGHENDTPAYINAVCAATRCGPTEQLDLHRYEALCPIVEAIIRHENGRGPKSTLNSWYDRATIDTGLQRAGVVKQAVVIAAVPVTKETVGATGTGAIGVAQAVDVAPHVIAAMQSQQEALSSGEVMKMVVAAVMIGLAVFIAYSQVKKHQAGVVA
jgi:hypothetical protein